MVIRGKRILKKNVITGPEIPNNIMLNTLGKDPKYYPTAKYIIVSKTFESKKSYKINGIPRITKAYGVGILTDKNIYYFSELHTRHSELTDKQREIFTSVFLYRYILTPSTRVLVTDNIGKHDPIYVFLKIMGSAIGCEIRFTNLLKLLRFINFKCQYIKGPKKNYSISKYHCKRLIQKLIDLNRFEFITEPGWVEKLNLKVAYMKKAYLECAIGIFNMYLRDIDIRYKKKCKENKLKQQIEELKKDKSYNTNNKEIL